MKLTIQKISGDDPLELDCDPESDVKSLKKAIIDLDPRGYWCVSISLLLDGDILSDDDCRLQDYGLVDGSALTLLKKPLTLALTGSEDRTMILWNAITGTIIQTYSGHTNTVTSVEISSDDLFIVTASIDGTAKIWNAVDAQCLQTFIGHKQPVFSAVCSANGTRVLTAAGDKTAKIWSVSSGRCRKTFVGHSNIVNSARFSMDESFVLTASWDKTAKVWDVTSEKNILAFRGHEKAVNIAVYSPDGLLVVTGSDDCTAKLWDAESGECKQTFSGHKGRLTSVAFCNSAVGSIVTSSVDGSFRFWDIDAGTCLVQSISGRVVFSVRPSVDGCLVITACGATVANIWDVSDKTCVQTLAGHKGNVIAAVFFNGVAASLDRTERVLSCPSEETDESDAWYWEEDGEEEFQSEPDCAVVPE